MAAQVFLSLFFILWSQALLAESFLSSPSTTSQFQPYKEIREVRKPLILNIGYSQLERTSYQGPAASGLTFEMQYSFFPKVFGTVTFHHYDYTDVFRGRATFQMAAFGGEVQPIQTNLLGGGIFFAAITSGGAFIFKGNGINLYYGAGIGFKFSDDIGVRFDVKSGPTYITTNTIALVGYY